jgi:hypothetical protein
MITVDNVQTNQTNQFNQILEMIDLLSPDEQEDLLNIIRHRQIEQRREEIANNIAQAHQEYQQNRVFSGSIDEIIAELNQ